MVEAAIIFPVVILTVMATFYLLINMYSQAASQANLHERLRQQVAESHDIMSVSINDEYVRDKYRRKAEAIGVSTGEGSMFGRKYLSAGASQKYFGGALASGAGYKYEFFGRKYIIDEEKLVRGAPYV